MLWNWSTKTGGWQVPLRLLSGFNWLCRYIFCPMTLHSLKNCYNLTILLTNSTNNAREPLPGSTTEDVEATIVVDSCGGHSRPSLFWREITCWKNFLFQKNLSNKLVLRISEWWAWSRGGQVFYVPDFHHGSLDLNPAPGNLPQKNPFCALKIFFIKKT